MGNGRKLIQCALVEDLDHKELRSRRKGQRVDKAAKAQETNLTIARKLETLVQADATITPSALWQAGTGTRTSNNEKVKGVMALIGWKWNTASADARKGLWLKAALVGSE